jgi:LAS superfamily LD-carboxypeptidase LdcB
MPHVSHRRFIVLMALIVLLLGALGYGYYRYRLLTQQSRAQLSTIVGLRSTIKELEGNISLTEYERDRLTFTLNESEQKAGELEAQTNELTATVGNLQKLTTIDPELLKKYSKVYFLNEHYVPSSLADIDAKYISGAGRTLQIHGEVWPHLRDLLDTATKDGVNLRIQSAYRSFGTQASLKAAYKVTYGTTAANRFSAEQGYSEHQLGTTVDFSTAKSASLSASFDTTPESKWLIAHAHEYGFVLSYPKNNTYYVYEPWHWRYVGIKLATKLHDDNTHLYDVDQREIDSYLLSIFD